VPRSGSFTAIRLISGALVLWVLVGVRSGAPAGRGSWGSALALLTYAAGFSYAYVSLTAATGALLLFGAVQATMIGVGFWRGERLRSWPFVGLVLALGGLVGLTAPPLQGAVLMLGAGAAWGIYSLRGKGAGDPTRVTAGNFARAVPIAVVMVFFTLDHAALRLSGVAYAVASGAVTSGIGYAIWYTALPGLKAMHAALRRSVVSCGWASH
jgi:drug/metabolite transporter (DMT)-like permease